MRPRRRGGPRRDAMLDPGAIATECSRAPAVPDAPDFRPRDRMTTTEYLSVLVSIIIGLGISQVLSGVANLLVDRRRVRFYWVWGVAVLMVFLANVQFWWSTFSVAGAVARNFFSFIFFLLTPITLYLGAVVVLPDFEGEGEIDLRRHFYDNHRWFFGFRPSCRC
jgi:hypothetical protein